MLLCCVLLLTLILSVRTSGRKIEESRVSISGKKSLLLGNSNENDHSLLRSIKVPPVHFLLRKTTTLKATTSATPQTTRTNPNLELKPRQYYGTKHPYDPYQFQYQLPVQNNAPRNLAPYRREQSPAYQPVPSSYGWNMPPWYVHSELSYNSEFNGMSNYWASSTPLNYWVSYPPVQPYQYSESQYGAQGHNVVSQSNTWIYPDNQETRVLPDYSHHAFTDMSYQWRPPTQTERFPRQTKPWPPPPFSQPELPEPVVSGWMNFSEFEPQVEVEHSDEEEVDTSHDVVTISDGFCTSPFMQLDKGCYYFSASEGITVSDWFAANKKCIAMKAHLAKMETLFESEILKLYVTTREWFSQHWYIGLKQSSYDEWQWADGLNQISTLAAFLLWCESEPEIGDRRCASWQPVPPSHSRFCWRSESCSHSLMDMHFICQKPIINGTQQRRLVHGKYFWRHEFWMPGYVDVIAEYGYIVPIK